MSASVSPKPSRPRRAVPSPNGAGPRCPTGIKTREQIAAVVAAVAPKPVNVLVGFVTDLTLSDLEALGVRRVSVGGALARSAWGGFMRAAQTIDAEGKFDGFASAAAGAALNPLFRKS
jgi:2-methylisocitrate lyase-like PEP mutase family enzyme